MDGLGGYDWVAWLGLAVVCGIIEVSSLDLLFAMVAAGALAGAVTAVATDVLIIQVLVALAVAISMLAVVRPVALRHLRVPLALRTGTDALVGQTGTVLEEVGRDTGRVKIRGEVWSARTYDPASVIAAGTAVEVMSIDGATAVVYQSEF